MKTTAIVVEMLIIGIQASIWVTLFSMSFFEYELIPAFARIIVEWKIIASFFILAWFYMLGILVDRIADYVIEITILRHLRRCNLIRETADRDTDDERMRIKFAEQKTTEFLEFLRGQIRIVRSIAFNVPLIALSNICFLLFAYNKEVSGWFYIIVIFISAIISSVALIIHAILENTYEIRVQQIPEQEQANNGIIVPS